MTRRFVMREKQGSRTPKGRRPAKTIRPSSGNVFADLRLPDADERLAKAELARQICDIVRQAGWGQADAAKRLGIDQPKISALMRGRLADFSTERLMRFLNALDRDVFILVRP